MSLKERMKKDLVLKDSDFDVDWPHLFVKRTPASMRWIKSKYKFFGCVVAVRRENILGVWLMIPFSVVEG